MNKRTRNQLSYGEKRKVEAALTETVTELKEQGRKVDSLTALAKIVSDRCGITAHRTTVTTIAGEMDIDIRSQVSRKNHQASRETRLTEAEKKIAELSEEVSRQREEIFRQRGRIQFLEDYLNKNHESPH